MLSAILELLPIMKLAISSSSIMQTIRVTANITLIMREINSQKHFRSSMLIQQELLSQVELKLDFDQSMMDIF